MSASTSGESMPLKRAGGTGLADDVRAAEASPVVSALLEAIDCAVAVLNPDGQIVAAELRDLGARATGAVTGLRLGEAVGCIHAVGLSAAYGEADACHSCALLGVVRACRSRRESVVGECLLTVKGDHAQPLEATLRATPLDIQGRPFTVLLMRDAGHEKRRAVLERVFFHDVLNLLNPLSMSAQLIRELPESQVRGAAERMLGMTRRLEAEIVGQRILLQAERGTLFPVPSLVRTKAVLQELKETVSSLPAARGRGISIEESADMAIHTDAVLLSRVLRDMAINALEASDEHGQIRLACHEEPAPRRCRFLVHNDTAMAPEVAACVFQRSFSTKATRARGLGTYAMKLLGERYLGASVGFTSTPAVGTTFHISLPERLEGRINPV